MIIVSGWLYLLIGLAGVAAFVGALLYASATGNRALLLRLWSYARPVVIFGGGFVVLIGLLLWLR